MTQKFFTISFDDGIEQDKKIIKLMQKYGIRGTFNISSGLFGQKTYIKRIFDLGYKEVKSLGKKRNNYVDHMIMNLEESQQVYGAPNVEVASHGAHHVNQTKITKEEADKEIAKDIQGLSEIFGYQVVGHAFPFGSYNNNVIDTLR